ncbi:MAG TPA: SemiSWEET transporter [Terracidiphilus sp.]|nr:SemiSWEET transporter [Terracidiphilus sp.]
MTLPAPSSRQIFEAVGSTAAFCTTVSFVPQLVRVWRRKQAEDISLLMFLLFCLGLLCWLIYGIGLHSMPMIMANTATLVLALAILVLKLRYDRRNRLQSAQPPAIGDTPSASTLDV